MPAVANAVSAYQASPGFAYGYVLGDAAAASAGAAARDGVGGVLDTWRQATDIFTTVIGLPAPTEVTLSLEVEAAMDAEQAPVGAARRFYNCINCYDGVAPTLATLYCTLYAVWRQGCPAGRDPGGRARWAC